ncbi:MAG: metallophosphoesterase [Candidatus Aenigmarchaeota archaeon]|nr:metallophosphoesterase [Candidatus Aenigmarchaeota archaeon]
MFKIMVVADIHGEFEKFSKIVDKIKEHDFDLVICPGDFTDVFNTPEGYSQVDITELILQKLLSFGKPVFCVPGNHDPYDTLDLLDEYNVNIHGRVKKLKGLEFVGFGGAATPFNTKFEPTEEEIKETLEKRVNDIKGKFILVTHNPPFGTNLDKTETGEHVGSKSIRGFIEKNKPLLAISAHIHEAGGIDKLGETTLFYPGVAYEGYYGLVEVGKEIKCEIKKF